MSVKTLCPIHHYYYEGKICPLCQQEKYERLSSKYKVKNEVLEIKEADNITEDDLKKLMDKFNGK